VAAAEAVATVDYLLDDTSLFQRKLVFATSRFNDVLPGIGGPRNFCDLRLSPTWTAPPCCRCPRNCWACATCASCCCCAACCSSAIAAMFICPSCPHCGGTQVGVNFLIIKDVTQTARLGTGSRGAWPALAAGCARRPGGTHLRMCCCDPTLQHPVDVAHTCPEA